MTTLKLPSSSNKQVKDTEKSAFKDGRHSASFHNMHECRKVKRLKSHRERNQLRGGGNKAPKPGCQHQHCHRLSSQDTTHFLSSRRSAASFCTAPVTKEPSVITEHRLTGHQGLFNHEVKSMDIERLLSEQRKMEKSTTSHVSPASGGGGVADGGTERLVLFEDKAGGASKAHDELCDKEKDKAQRPAPTPEDRPHQAPPEPSPESCKSTFSANHSKQITVRTFKIRNGKHVPSVEDRGTELLSTAAGENTETLCRNAKETGSSEEHTPKCPGLRSPTFGLSPGKRPSSRSAEDADVQPSGDLHGTVSQSVGTLAAALCHRLRFPFLKKSGLAEESRQVLLRCLQERGGAQLQENLLQVWSRHSVDSSAAKGPLHQQEPTVDQDEARGTKELFAAFIPESPACFESPGDATRAVRRSSHLSWTSTPHSACSTSQVRPEEASVGFLDNIFGCTRSPELCVNFEPFGSTASEPLFTPSPASSWREKQAASPHWGDGFNWPRSKENLRCDSLSRTRMADDGRSSRSHYSTRPSFLYQPRPQPLRRPLGCLQHRVPLETETRSLVPHSAQWKHQRQEGHFQASHQTAPPLSCFPRASHLPDMDIYPPSSALDKEPPPCFPSLEPWSFPPMRLY